MEDLSPTLWMVLIVRKSLEQGESVGLALQKVQSSCPKSIAAEFFRWKWALEQGKINAGHQFVKSAHRVFVYQLFERGLAGEPIYTSLLQVEEEIVRACRTEMEEWITKLPFLLLVPLMLLQFPALILITLGPFFQEMLNSIGGHSL